VRTIDSFVGRAAELNELGELLDRSGEPRAVYLVGEAGVGKTALLEAAVAVSAAADTEVLWARATAAEQSSSYAALDDLLRPALGQLPRLPEPQGRALAGALLLEEAAVPVEPRLVGLAVLSLLRSLGAAQPP
jgi:predicted ATPase